MKQRLRTMIIIALSFWMLAGGTATAWGMGQKPDAPRMTKETLKSLLGNPDVIILDVRLDKEWQEGKGKIQGAVREDPEKSVQSWADKYPKDKTLVFYCS